MKTAQQLFDENFTHNTTRCKRSAAYKKGALTVLKYKIHGGDLSEVPYTAGSAGSARSRERARIETI